MKFRTLLSLLLCLILVTSLTLPVFAEGTALQEGSISAFAEDSEGGTGDSGGTGSGNTGSGGTGDTGGNTGSGGTGDTGGNTGSGGTGDTGGNTGSGDTGDTGSDTGNTGGDTGDTGGTEGGGETGGTGGEGAKQHEHVWVLVRILEEATCENAGRMRVRCASCGEIGEQVIGKRNHTYDNACDPDCNVCHATRKVAHSPSGTWSGDAENHWHACTVCGGKVGEAAHSPGPEATMEREQVCLICGYVIQKALDHIHQFETNLSYDETGHWYSCEQCDEQKDFQEHVYDDACDPDCNICGYLREDAHSYEKRFQSDEKNHWKVCTLCGEESEHTAHVPGNPATEEHAQVCEVCGREIAPQLNHVHEVVEWTYDGQTHEGKCACGEIVEQGPHSWGAGTKNPDGTRTVTCIQCGAEKLDTAGMEEQSSGMMAIGIAALVCAVGAAAALAVVLIRQSKYMR